ncbi:hypothetical protein CNR22_24370, partial [Sphingobacteriaceae bacterium]
ITLTITNTFSAGVTCSSTAQKNVTVYAQPDPTFTTSALSCNNSVTLGLTALTNTFTSYTINYGDGTSPVSSNSTGITSAHKAHTYPTSPAFTVYPLTVTLFNGSCSLSYSQAIVINNNASLQVTTPSQFICPGSLGYLNAVVSAQSSAAPFTYVWAGPAGFTSSLASITATSGGVYNVTVTSAACSLSLTGTKTMTLLAQPTGTVTDIANITCTSVAGGTANIIISSSLQVQGFVINGVTVTPNSLATTTLAYPISGLGQGANYVSIANGLNESCRSSLLINISKIEPTLNVAVTHASSCGMGASGSATLTPSIAGGSVNWYASASYPGTALTSTSGLQVTSLVQGNYVVKYILWNLYNNFKFWHSTTCYLTFKIRRCLNLWRWSNKCGDDSCAICSFLCFRHF